jgi:hypothetical protein
MRATLVTWESCASLIISLTLPSMIMSHLVLKSSDACFPLHPGDRDPSISHGKRMKAV